MKNRAIQPPGRVASFTSLVNTFGAEAVAEKLLSKWLTDPNADQKWERLQTRVEQPTAIQSLPPPFRRAHSWLIELPQHNRNRLTGRERAILTAAANGLTSRQTGERVYRCERVVVRHRTSLIRKLGARNITHAVALYWRAAS